MTLPPTYKISSEILLTTPHPSAFGGFCDVYQGSVGPESVCIKRFRIGITDERVFVMQVSNPQNSLLDCQS